MTEGALDGMTALVTGGGRGIGKAIAVRFAAEGASVAIASRSRGELESVAEACREAGGQCSIHVCDVSDRSDAKRLMTAVGPIDVLVNSAGVYGPIGPVTENDLDQWEAALRINLLGTLYTCREAIPGMVRRGRGSIINLAGGGATAPLPNFSAYAVSKAAVTRLTDTLAGELSGTGVRVNAIAPGLVDTRLQDDVIAAGSHAGALFARIQQARKSGEGTTSPDVAASLAVFLASNASHGLSGKLISAPHDPWKQWDESRIETLNGSGWFTVRRLDPFTIRQLGPEP